MKRLLSVILVVLVILNCSMVAYAEESQATEDSPVAVTTLEELQAAIAAAADGDTIFIASTIIIESDCTIGLADKKITLVAAEGIQGNLIKVRGATVNFLGVTIDGSNGFCTSTVINSGNAELDFQNCTFQRNKTIVVYVEQSTKLSFVSCLMQNNSQVLSMRGIGSIEMDNCIIKENNANITCLSIAGEASISNCQFLNNTIATEGSVLSFISSHTSRINSCQFIGNRSSSGSGAAISTGGNTTISNCFFNGNEAGIAGNDIFVQEYGTLNILDTDEQLASLYSAHGVQYNGTFIDAKYERYNVVSSPKRIELPATNYVGALCFVSEEIPATEPDESTEVTDPNQGTEPEDPNESEEIPGTPSVVTNCGELLSAIDAAADGEVITVSNTIVIDRNCTIGKDTETITLSVSKEFEGESLFQVVSYEGQDIKFQNIWCDTSQNSRISALYVNTESNQIDNMGKLYFYRVYLNGFSPQEYAVVLNNVHAEFKQCAFNYNWTGKSDLLIESSANVRLIDTSITNTRSYEIGSAIICKGNLYAESSLFGWNSQVSGDGSLESQTYGGAIRIEEGGSCHLVNCDVKANFASFGGGIYSKGTLTIEDSTIAQNFCNDGGADFYLEAGSQISITFTEAFDPDKYTVPDPIGFYLDSEEQRFSAAEDAVFLGEDIRDSVSVPYGIKYGFKHYFPSNCDIPTEPQPLPALPPPEGEEDTKPTEPEETEDTTPIDPEMPPTVPEETEETTPPPAPSESEETETTTPTLPEDTTPTAPTTPTTPTVPTPPPEETLPDGTEDTEPTDPPADDDVADTEPTIPEDTDPPEDEPTNPPETEDSEEEETTDNQDRTQYIYYIPQTPATENTEPTATEESASETTQGVTEQQNPYTGDASMFAPEATGTPQGGASGEDEIDITLRELRVLVAILLVAEVLQFACFIIIWGLPKLKGIYKGRYKRRM